MAEDNNPDPIQFCLTDPTDPHVHWFFDRRAVRRLKHESRIAIRFFKEDGDLLCGWVFGVVMTERPHPRRRVRIHIPRWEAKSWIGLRNGKVYEIAYATGQMVDLDI